MLTLGSHARPILRGPGIHLGRHGAPADQLVDPLAKAAKVLEVVFGAGLMDPPRRLVGLLAERVPLLDHPRAPGVRLGPDDVPWLVAHRLPEGSVEGVDVDVMTLSLIHISEPTR